MTSISILLHVTQVNEEGKRVRRTFVIAEDGAGGIDIVDAKRPRCEADSSVPLDDGTLLEVEL